MEIIKSSTQMVHNDQEKSAQIDMRKREAFQRFELLTSNLYEGQLNRKKRRRTNQLNWKQIKIANILL